MTIWVDEEPGRRQTQEIASSVNEKECRKRAGETTSIIDEELGKGASQTHVNLLGIKSTLAELARGAERDCGVLLRRLGGVAVEKELLRMRLSVFWTSCCCLPLLRAAAFPLLERVDDAWDSIAESYSDS